MKWNFKENKKQNILNQQLSQYAIWYSTSNETGGNKKPQRQKKKKPFFNITMHQSVFNLSLLLSQYTGSKIFWSNIKHMDVKLYPFLRMERTLQVHTCMWQAWGNITNYFKTHLEWNLLVDLTIKFCKTIISVFPWGNSKFLNLNINT